MGRGVVSIVIVLAVIVGGFCTVVGYFDYNYLGGTEQFLSGKWSESLDEQQLDAKEPASIEVTPGLLTGVKIDDGNSHLNAIAIPTGFRALAVFYPFGTFKLEYDGRELSYEKDGIRHAFQRERTQDQGDTAQPATSEGQSQVQSAGSPN